MKISNQTVETTSIGTTDEIQSKIRSEDLGLALRMVSKNLYSNPIGSFIRELSSNGVDANVDANNNNPIRIDIYQEDDLHYCKVADQGIGMSPDKFADVYMAWFNSDKRDSDIKIGGWGLGSKSPLSYQESFEITTIHNGIRYEYVMANEDPVPKATLISEEATHEPNGTTIIVEIKEEDRSKVHEECLSQLAYFNNVFVVDDMYFYDNEFEIYESEDFKVRTKSTLFNGEMHICLGQVAYPINWATLGLAPIKIPVALSFKIEELEVTLSREEINYTEGMTEFISNKIEKVTDYLFELYSKQLCYDDLNSYLSFYYYSNNRPTLKIGDVEIIMPSNSKLKARFNPFPDLKLNKHNWAYVLRIFNTRQLNSGGTLSEYNHDSYMVGYPHECFYATGSINFYDSHFVSEDYYGDMYVTTAVKMNRQIYRTYCEILNLYDKNGVKKPNSIQIINNFIQFIKGYYQGKFKHYSNYATPERIAEYKEEKRLYAESRKEIITHYGRHNRLQSIKSGDLVDLLNNGHVFYLNKKDDEVLIEHYKHLFKTLPTYFSEKLHLFVFSMTTINKLKRYDRIHPVKDIFKIKTLYNHFYRIKLSALLIDFYDDNAECTVTNTSKHYSRIYHSLRKTYKISAECEYFDKYESLLISNIYTYFKNQIADVRPHLVANHHIMLHDEKTIKKLIDLKEELAVLYYLESAPISVIGKILVKYKILKFNHYYYKSF